MRWAKVRHTHPKREEAAEGAPPPGSPGKAEESHRPEEAGRKHRHTPMPTAHQRRPKSKTPLPHPRKIRQRKSHTDAAGHPQNATRTKTAVRKKAPPSRTALMNKGAANAITQLMPLHNLPTKRLACNGINFLSPISAPGYVSRLSYLLC